MSTIRYDLVRLARVSVANLKNLDFNFFQIRLAHVHTILRTVPVAHLWGPAMLASGPGKLRIL